MTDIPLLSLAIWVPIIGGLLVLATGSDRNAPLARMLALAVAVAGFEREELELETENGTLKVKGRKGAAAGERQFLHQGIAERDFELAFKLSQHVEVQGARLEHGLLTIDLARELPEALKPRASACAIDRAPRKNERPSDHAPVVITL